MNTKQKAKGSWGIRFFIVLLGIILGILFYWLLSFVEQDIGSAKGPDWEQVRREFVTQELDDTSKELQKEVQQLNRNIDSLREQQRMLGNSTNSLQKTMNQLLSIQKQYIEKGQEFPPESVKTLQESQAAFLENQTKDQQFTKDISELVQLRQQKEDTLSSVSEQIKTLEEKAREKNNELWKKYRLKVAIFKLSFLVPVFLVISYLFMKFRSGSYWALVWAAFIAAFLKIAVVAHKYFPTNYFKYIAILVILAIVLRLLVYLIKMITAPKKDLLIKQYQQYYDKHLCPICTKPIKTGPLRFTRHKKKAALFAPAGTEAFEQQPYTCPSCGTNLYDKCGSCGKIRHTLLPYCEHCGAEKRES